MNTVISNYFTLLIFLVLGMLHRGLSAQYYSSYQCVLAGDGKNRPETKVSSPAVDGFFKMMRASLSSSGQTSFDLLWKKYGVEILVKIAEQAETEEARDSLEADATNSQASFLFDHHCTDPMTYLPLRTPECKITCTLIR